MFLIGLTGGIASGKSTVSSFFHELGCPIIDADKIAREVVEPGKPAWKLIVQHFGREVLQADGTLDRPKLGNIIFNDSSKRKLLNSCTHPAIQREMIWQVIKCLFKGYHFVVLDVPLLLDGSALKSFMNQIVVVYCDEETQLERLKTLRNLTQEEAVSRIQSQLPLSEKSKLADHVLDNSGKLETTKAAVARLHAQFNSSYAHWKLRSVAAVLVTLFFGVCTVCVRSLL
ncbi:putative dephospho-CoA kinase domain-containing protein [Apostichopus japonicus]|uniref:Dephospho-CoA kinase domain-containing protein n=1 Tax=Stichopus japonicus TaxID=307972 RepID=A0A2G8JQ57_STIJA|nr:putative dephospho-CoA kinase domain-containing protein [Apostichopus japonicus]